MKLTTGILAITITMTAGGTLAPQAAAQNPDAIDNARSIAKSLQQKQANDSNAALDAAGVGQPAKPAPGAPAPAVKPAVIPGSQPASKPAAASAAKSASASSQHTQLQHVNVVPGADGIQIELSSSDAVTPRVSKLSSPARILVELPGTISAAPQNHISIASGGVKGVRIGTDGKTPPTTSVVVDLDKAVAFEMTPGPEGKLVLTLHTDGSAVASAKSSPAPAKTVAAKATAAPAISAPKLVTESSSTPKLSSVKASSATSSPSITIATTAKPAVTSKPATALAAKAAVTQTPVASAPSPAAAASPVATKGADTAKPGTKAEDKKWAMNGKRDPFFSPVVQQPTGSGCSTGKKCLEIGNINLRGVVKSDAGFIAVVTNSLNKAYFLRENDPVFNGYVVKITGDSVVFQETVEDKLGKPFTREVVKRIFTPAV
jgi:hypothetical protein